ncbi:hypothetical protein K431DRAFT_224609 [Polychaeton citri CBS 116435]|uniref:Uncharacterized protein n=1 Tax=Polychaeton citri CBS 116435 TaxID=1314669 RepID=A0A9P4Q622_9PEZI|nr:hypothetical protein K431DRAFT_224609 [Polychaeton citri CBS 116435]
MARYTNFTECGIRWLQESAQNQTLIDLYGWSGPVQHIPKNTSTQISTYGCKQFCGTGTDFYPWSQSSATITTWVLPIIGLIVQAPFVSNAFWDTVFSISRWTGSPMASLGYILWNIRTSGKCALMVDMASSYKPQDKERREHFTSIRDSFYLLMTMNQYQINRKIRVRREASGLLRMVLFSKDLHLLKSSHIQQRRNHFGQERLDTLRRALAQDLRKTRRRGVVPVFVSVMWFLFSLSISIQSSFDDLGRNSTAHDLALGLMLSWMPVLILCSIVDRNPVSADDVQDKLNLLVERVRISLQDDDVRKLYLNTIKDIEKRAQTSEWMDKINSAGRGLHVEGGFFTRFAGQGRVRWHYGVAHPILTDIEAAYVKEEGRDWLHNESEARTHLVLGKADDGLDWFDYRELWQLAAAIIIVVGCSAGAWFISYFTPTVGLGCRSGGYTVFVSAALGLLVVEMAVWWLMDAQKQRLKRLWEAYGARRFSTSQKHHTFRKYLEWMFFRPLELANTGFLCYLAMAQTIGADNTCNCMTSGWAPGGGYLDFTQWNVANSDSVKNFWIAGTSIACTIMGLSMLYIVMEWCLQSHLSTADIESASHGLRRTRRFRYSLYTILLGAPDAMSKTSLRWHASIFCTKIHHPHSARYNRKVAESYELKHTATVQANPIVLAEDYDDLDVSRSRVRKRDDSASSINLLKPEIAYSRSSSEHSPHSSTRIDHTYEQSDEDTSGHLRPSTRRGYPRRSSNGSPTRRDEELANMRHSAQ